MHGERQLHKLRLSRQISTAGCPGLCRRELCHLVKTPTLLLLQQRQTLFLQCQHVRVPPAKVWQLQWHSTCSSSIHGKALIEQRAIGVMDVLEVQVTLALPRLRRKCLQVVLLQTQSESPNDVAEREVGQLARRNVTHVTVDHLDITAADIRDL